MDREFDGVYRIISDSDCTGYGGSAPRSSGFSRHELRDITVSVLALSLAMAIIFHRTVISPNPAVNFAIWFLTSVILILTSFLLHEFGHKFAAQRYGAWAEFRMFPLGLGLAILMSFLGFMFAAPGAVYISGRFTEKQNGIISAAGPAVNIVLAVVFMIANHFMPFGFIGLVFFLLAWFNATLALFNLIPIPPLDGSKVIRWNPLVWIAMLIASGAMVFVMF